MKGYKAFNKGLICRNKQYAENTVFEESKSKMCESGMHFCENPLDTLDYYPLLNNDNELTEFAEVEALDEPVEECNKCCSKKLKIGAKLDLKGFIKASVDFIFKKSEASSRDDAQLASSGYCAKLASSGDNAKLASSGNFAQLASSGYCAKLASSGYCAKLASSGEGGVIAAIGINNQAKGSTGTWITLAEYDDDNRCKCVKSLQVDGKTIKADTFYMLKNGVFTEATE